MQKRRPIFLSVWLLAAALVFAGCGAPSQGAGGASASVDGADCGSGCDVLAPGGEVVDDTGSDGTGPSDSSSDASESDVADAADATTAAVVPTVAGYVAYADLLVQTVVPLVDATYRTLPDRAHRGIEGSSLGGISATWIAWDRWQTFGFFASFSGAFWVGEGLLSDTGKKAQGPPMRELIGQNVAGVPKGVLRAYIDSGDTAQDGTVCYGCDSWVYSDWTRNALIAAGWDDRPAWETDADPNTPPANLPDTTAVAQVPSIPWSAQPPAGSGWKSYLGTDKNLLSLVGHGQKHNEAAWKARVGAALRYLLPRPALP